MQIKYCCDTMEKSVELGELSIVYFDKFREYGLKVLDGGSSYQLIEFCPWCGVKLPASLRDEWFDLLDELNLDDPDDPRLPIEMTDGSWWRKKERDG